MTNKVSFAALNLRSARIMKKKVVNKGKLHVVSNNLRALSGLHFSHAKRKMVIE